jgi:hypothetical protein
MAYDSRCYDLAEIFLLDEPELASEVNTKELAQAIQDAIENFIADAKRYPLTEKEAQRSVALQRIIDEVRNRDSKSTGYNRTYHRHNR